MFWWCELEERDFNPDDHIVEYCISPTQKYCGGIDSKNKGMAMRSILSSKAKKTKPSWWNLPPPKFTLTTIESHLSGTGLKVQVSWYRLRDTFNVQLSSPNAGMGIVGGQILFF